MIRDKEFLITMFINRIVLSRYSDLKSTKLIELNNQTPFNLYMILKGNSILLNPQKCKIDQNGELGLSYNVTNRNDVSEKEFKLNLNTKYVDEAELKIVYPNKEFKIYYKGEVLSGGFLPAILREIKIHSTNDNTHEIEESDDLDLELLYVGQSKGAKKESNALMRLVNHSTYQEILATEHYEDPNCEIYIAVLSLETIINLVVIPDYNYGNKLPEETLNRIMASDKFKIESINITEAALIKYFQPKYNKDFIDTFPSIYHSSYRFFYDNDIHSILVELVIYDKIGSRIFTSKIDKYDKNIITFQISGKSTKLGILTIPSEN